MSKPYFNRKKLVIGLAKSKISELFKSKNDNYKAGLEIKAPLNL
jgi:hypothetical protein